MCRDEVLHLAQDALAGGGVLGLGNESLGEIAGKPRKAGRDTAAPCGGMENG